MYFYPQDCLKCSQYAKQQDPKFRETLDYSVERCVFNFPLFLTLQLKAIIDVESFTCITKEDTLLILGSNFAERNDFLE